MTYYLDFSNQVSRFTDVTPSQLSSRDLLNAIESRKMDLDRDTQTRLAKLRTVQQKLADTLRSVSVEDLDVKSNTIQQLTSIQQELVQLEKQKSINFYLQYYRAELHKKIALSISCFVLVFITFPLSYLRLKHGRLFGFGLSLVVASTYWFLLFFAQTKILDVTINPGFLIWIPNLVIGALSALLLLRSRHV
jgi:lipopolysaccharide export system permease protein